MRGAVADFREFTLEEARATLPRVREIVADLRDAWETHELLSREIHARLGGRPFETLPAAEQGEIAQHLPALSRLKERIRARARELEEIGCVLKGPDQGLVDYFSRRNGEPIWLCWRLGEEDILYYHGFEEGFAGRRRIDF
ncbi:MAG: DUF2203 family protein [Nitrospirae bacterium]|nr:MAG: DUF2203 family protein [Nitrospirota bacterium]